MPRFKARLDRETGELVVITTYRDFRELLRAADLNAMQTMRETRGVAEDEGMNLYATQLHGYIKGIELLLDMQLRPCSYVDPLAVTRSVEQRMEAVIGAKREREFLDHIADVILERRRMTTCS
jgi:hypothetical protein